ncbi:MAG: response regulator [Ginsengibacter sp.]
MANILIVDDNPIVQSILKFLIGENFDSCTVKEANDCITSIHETRENKYDLVLLNVNTPGIGSVAHINHLLSLQQDLKIILFGINHEESVSTKLLKTGSMGYLAKGDSEKEIKTAVRNILNNKKYISPKLNHLAMAV